jgi:hypothetical protein
MWVVGKTVATNLMAVVDQLFQVRDVIFAPIDPPPIARVTGPGIVRWVLIGGQEESGLYAVAVENGSGFFKLAPEPIVESEGNKRLYDRFQRLLLALCLSTRIEAAKTWDIVQRVIGWMQRRQIWKATTGSSPTTCSRNPCTRCR